MLYVSYKTGYKLEFDDELHEYRMNGGLYPGVTTINKMGFPQSYNLGQWVKKQGINYMADEMVRLDKHPRELTKKELTAMTKAAMQADRKKSKDAANIGTLAHDYAYQWETRGEIDEELRDKIEKSKDREKVLQTIKLFRRWKRKNKDTILESEGLCASPSHWYAGKFDSLRNRAGRIIVSDFKTSNGIYCEQLIQLCGYKLAIEEWKGIKVDAIEVLRFGKEDAEFEEKLIDDPRLIKLYEDQFLRNVQTYYFRLQFDK